ncbi:MAG: response regulator [Candidatus Sedimenticola sp. PURPLELP]
MSLILVVDDEESVLLNLVAYIEDEGYDVISAANGEEALQLIGERRPDLGIMDMRLPGMDGNELISRAFEAHPKMKFLVHTGSADYSVPPELERIGLTEKNVFKKPVSDMAIFTKAIADLLAG